MKLWNVRKIRESKHNCRLACLTAYDYPTARLLDAAGIPLILVGDSLGMTALGYEDTLRVTMEQMLHHTAAVTRGVRDALVVGDMPFLSCPSVSQGLLNAGRFLQEAGADAVKIEGGTHREEMVRALTENGIPVMGHLGLLPQRVRAEGGYRVQGREHEAAETLMREALALEQAGIFALVLECLPASLAKTLTDRLSVPTIGIGAGADCDGQILVTHDLLGLSKREAPRFVKRFADLAPLMDRAFSEYAEAVRTGAFPEKKHEF